MGSTMGSGGGLAGSGHSRFTKSEARALVGQIGSLFYAGVFALEFALSRVALFAIISLACFFYTLLATHVLNQAYVARMGPLSRLGLFLPRVVKEAWRASELNSVVVHPVRFLFWTGLPILALGAALRLVLSLGI